MFNETDEETEMKMFRVRNGSITMSMIPTVNNILISCTNPDVRGEITPIGAVRKAVLTDY